MHAGSVTYYVNIKSTSTDEFLQLYAGSCFSDAVTRPTHCATGPNK